VKYLEDFKVGDVERFGSYPMTREEVIEFATRFDPQPFHVDDAAGAAHPMFRKLAASGWHTAAATMRMTVNHNETLGVASLGSPGLDQISWPAPTYPGDTLSVQAEVLEVRPSNSRPEMGFVKIRTTTLNQDGKVVMTFTANVMIATRPKG
jgi:acyl dehydratase